MVLPPDADAKADDWRAELVGRFTTVSGFVTLLTRVIEFGANAEGEQVLAAMQQLPEILAHRSRRTPASLVPGRLIDPDAVPGPRLVFGHPARADQTVTMPQRDGHPTALGEALAAYGRASSRCTSWPTSTPTSPTVATSRTSATCRRAATICHGKKGELYHAYERGLENQLDVLGLVLNCVVLWNTVYLNAAVEQLKTQGYPVRKGDIARMSPFVRKHLGVHGTYSFAQPDLDPGTVRQLRDPDAPDDK